jgi:hypothetical protein
MIINKKIKAICSYHPLKLWNRNGTIYVAIYPIDSPFLLSILWIVTFSPLGDNFSKFLNSSLQPTIPYNDIAVSIIDKLNFCSIKIAALKLNPPQSKNE